MIEKILRPKTKEEIRSVVNEQDIYSDRNIHNKIINFFEKGRFSNLDKQTVKTYLEEYANTNSLFTSKIFSMACRFNELEFVKIMLKNHNFDPTEYNNFALKLAYHNDAYDVIDYLLKDKRISSSLTQLELTELQSYLLNPFE